MHNLILVQAAQNWLMGCMLDYIWRRNESRENYYGTDLCSRRTRSFLLTLFLPLRINIKSWFVVLKRQSPLVIIIINFILIGGIPNNIMHHFVVTTAAVYVFSCNIIPVAGVLLKYTYGALGFCSLLPALEVIN